MTFQHAHDGRHERWIPRINGSAVTHGFEALKQAPGFLGVLLLLLVTTSNAFHLFVLLIIVILKGKTVSK